MSPAQRVLDVSISTVCLSGTLEDKLRAAASAGFSGVELLEYDLIMSPWPPRRFAREAADLGLSVEVYQPFHVETVPPDRFDAALRRAERKFELLSELGAHVLVCCSSRTDDGVDDEGLTAEQLHALAERAAQSGVRLAYEAVPWGRVRTYEDAWRLIERVDHPALGLCLDSFHVLSADNDANAVSRVEAGKVFHVQLADAPRLDMDVREWSLHYRMFPGQGALDVAGFLGRLLSMGYSGPLSLEVFNDIYQQEDPRHAAIDAMRSMRALAETLAARDPDDAPASLPGGGLPPAPRLEGFAFAEFAVDEVSGPLVSRALAGLGFAHVAQHRSKPVQLWQQGDARVLLNSAPERSIDPATSTIGALGGADRRRLRVDAARREPPGAEARPPPGAG
jgi:sugar phosphate isomerase/epimerase